MLYTKLSLYIFLLTLVFDGVVCTVATCSWMRKAKLLKNRTVIITVLSCCDAKNIVPRPATISIISRWVIMIIVILYLSIKMNRVNSVVQCAECVNCQTIMESWA